MQHPTVCCAKRVFASTSAQVRKSSARGIGIVRKINIFSAGVGPARTVVVETHAVDEPQETASTYSIEDQVSRTKCLTRKLTPELSMESKRFL
jgi:hypothetical protein